MKLAFKLESLLFVAARSLSLNELAKILKLKKEEIKEALNYLQEDYKNNQRGLNLITSGDKYQLTTSPLNSKEVAKLLEDEISGELTRPSLEALTIIAYKGPVTKLEIEKIRGVNCSLIIRNLLLRGLIEEKFDKVKQDNYYIASLDFIRHLGINSCLDLPDYERLNKHDALNYILNN